MKKPLDTISVIGLGYIGLPTAAMFASRRKRVIGVDVDQTAIETINRGQIHIVEPELDIIVHSVVGEGWLRATARPEPADAFLIAVPTPFKGAHTPDVSFVRKAAESIAPVLSAGNIVILESTSPVGTTEMMKDWLAAARPDLRFPGNPSGPAQVNVAYCPERVLPGHVVRELVENDRIIGGLTVECSARAVAVYQIFVRGQLLITDARTAEMCKLTENSFRDVNIAFANELSIISDKLGIDVWELIALANRHPRVNILQPGAGVGGHCIAVDPWFIVDSAPDNARLIRTAREVNDGKPAWIIEKVKHAVAAIEAERRASGPVRIACFGLSFKPDIDDLRESPAVQITTALATLYRGRVIAVEPNISRPAQDLESAGVVMLDTANAIAEADVLVMLVDHASFKSIDKSTLRGKAVVDAKGIWR